MNACNLELGGPSALIDMSKWAKLEYSREDANAAGKVLRGAFNANWRDWGDEQWEEYLNATDIINNWRSAHGLPLNTFQTTLRNSARRFDPEALIAQRTKRLVSIAKKLYDRPTMKLTQMQDIGGCRAVVKTVAQVKALQAYYENQIDFLHERSAPDDYISNPKPDSGYRSVHLMYRYKSDNAATEIYNGLKIEMQLRSNFQHAWATAVETVGTFVGQALKSSQGGPDWLRFFKLMGSVIALRERCPLVPDTPHRRNELRAELEYYVNKLDVEKRLRSYSVSVTQIRQKAKHADSFYLLQIDPVAEKLEITGFGKDALEEAQAKYAEAEKLVQKNPRTDAVLVSVDSLAQLEKAYPNYFADTRVFAQLMNRALTGQRRGISIPAPIKIEASAVVSPAKG